MGWVALLDEKKTRRTRDFTLLVGSSFFVSREPSLRRRGDRLVIAASCHSLPALCAQAGGRKCIVRAATAEELLLAVLAALEVNTTPLARDSLAGLCLHTDCAPFQSQGVHIPPESMPVQLLHRDAEFRESVSAPLYGFTGR